MAKLSMCLSLEKTYNICCHEQQYCNTCQYCTALDIDIQHAWINQIAIIKSNTRVFFAKCDNYKKHIGCEIFLFMHRNLMWWFQLTQNYSSALNSNHENSHILANFVILFMNIFLHEYINISQIYCNYIYCLVIPGCHTREAGRRLMVFCLSYFTHSSCSYHHRTSHYHADKRFNFNQPIIICTGVGIIFIICTGVGIIFIYKIQCSAGCTTMTFNRVIAMFSLW